LEAVEQQEAAPVATESPQRPASTVRERVHADMMHLAGELLHRGAQTTFERRAAEYIRHRFRQYTRDVEMDEFHAFENPPRLLASHFAEFLFVGLFAQWMPLVGLLYGIGVFIAFLAEFHGVRLISRLWPEFETQNVIARFLTLRPRIQILVTAHYDSGAATPLSDPGIVRLLRPGLLAATACMVLVLATCAVDLVGGYRGIEFPAAVYVRWGAIALLLGGAAFLYFASAQTEDIRGANNNASGVAALLELAHRLHERPIEGADVCLAATGSHEAWMSGARRLLENAGRDKRHIYLLNIEAVGAGSLHYTTAEGMLHAMPCSKDMISAAAASAQARGATPTQFSAVPSGAHIPLASGYHAMSILRLGPDGIPSQWNTIDDRITALEESDIIAATDFAEDTLRALANKQALDSATPGGR